MGLDVAALKSHNATRWGQMHVRAQYSRLIDEVAERMFAAKARYETVAKQFNMPWFVIPPIHERECSMSWTCYIGNGQSLKDRTTIIPINRGPFDTWEDGAIDAFKLRPLNIDWSIGALLTYWELYNGPGYAFMGHPSPYIWAYSDQYISGKFTSDRHYDPAAVDRQLGCAAMLARLQLIDKTIAL